MASPWPKRNGKPAMLEVTSADIARLKDDDLGTGKN